MSQQTINLGTADKGNGDPLRVAFAKVNGNFTELYNSIEENNGTIDLSAVAQSIIPSTDATYDLGSPNKQWRSIYVSTSTIYINNIPVSLDEYNRLTVGGNAIETTLEVDGGNAFTVYTAELEVDGGGA